jgi:hypothetical protein
MKRQLIRALLPAAALVAVAAPAAAQYPYPYPNAAVGSAQSPLSPYLNLQSGRGNPAVNYYNFVRPGLQAQQQQYSGYGGFTNIDPFSLGTDLTADPTKQLPRPTGVPAYFMNYGGNFNAMGTIGVPYGGRPGGGAPSASLGRPAVPSIPRQ